MTYKTLLLASAAVMFAGSAMAADLTNPFYLPEKGNFTSDTKIQQLRTKFTEGSFKNDQVSASEELTYGLTDNLAVFGTLVNDFNAEGYYNNDHNFTYTVGTVYNMRFDNVLAQVKGGYKTWNPKDYSGHETPSRWRKSLVGEAKLGYDMGDGLVPYLSYQAEGDVDEADRFFTQSFFAGVHKYTGKWAFDGGLRYNLFADQTNKDVLYAQAEVDYYLLDNLALGVYGSQFLTGKRSGIDRENVVGFRAKVGF